MDLIDRETAYKVLTEYYHHRLEIQHKGLREALAKVPTTEAPVVMMCNGDHIKCPAHKDYERGYKDGRAETLMTAEPKRGRWVESCGGKWHSCSVCGGIPPFNFKGEDLLTDYCPKCGARMDGGEK